MANTYKNILKSGKQAAYDALAERDNEVLYFTSDTHKIYKGNVDFTASVIVAASKPESPVVGKVYVLADTGTVEAYVDGKWNVISHSLVTSISDAATDDTVASAKSVYTFVTDEINKVAGSAGLVASIANKEGTDATVTITKADKTTEDLTIKGVVTTPTWDAVERKLTLPVAGGSAVEVNIGKDIFLDPSAENKYNTETKTIDLYLNDGTTGADGQAKPSTKISIPASDLIDIYTGQETSSATVAVSEDNKITATVKLSADTKNALRVTEDSTVQGDDGSSTTVKGGLFLDLSAYAKSADVTVEINNAITAAQATQKTTDDAQDARITALETAKTENDGNLAALAQATTAWGTF